jgi:hypothetical protein
MAELRDVLARHGRLGRFALHLAHRHFALRDDEVLVEYSDAVRREQWTRAEPRTPMPCLRHGCWAPADRSSYASAPTGPTKGTWGGTRRVEKTGPDFFATLRRLASLRPKNLGSRPNGSVA